LSFFGLFAIKPTLTTAVKLNREIQELRDLNAKYEEKITNIVKAQSAYENIREDIPLFFMTLPDNPEFTSLIMTHEKIATASNMSLEQMALDPVPISKEKRTGVLNSFDINLLLSGNYIDLSSFLDHFLKSQRLVSIDQLNLDQKNSTADGILRTQIKSKSYYEQ
ncbi:type 4a pilus biogenesis protein PilO, partial [Candidatus Gottesmanbacteria bacterium]|nr:type 4a pilus biogenesis protein PilO [Candidatus Gottesmanbacteria bacterium]